MGKNKRRRRQNGAQHNSDGPTETKTTTTIARHQNNHTTSKSTPIKKKRPKRGTKLTIHTNSKDYGGSLSLPEQISQRKYESTGEFMARINRMVAQAKEQAGIEAKFDTKL